MNAPAIIILLLLCAGLFKDISFLATLLFILPVFGALALLPPALVGDVTLLPASFAALLLLAKTFSYPASWRMASRAMLDVRQMGLLCLFLVIAVAGAILLPRAFAGIIRVVPIRIASTIPLQPTGANFTQSAYLTLSCLTAVAFHTLIRRQGFVDIFLKAVLFGAYAVIGTGLLDIFAHAAGFAGLLTYFQTASYTFMTDNFVIGARRIIGLMSEASSYGMMAASYAAALVFLRPAYPPKLWRLHVPAASLGCLFMACLSTSSTAFVMVGVLLSLYVFYRTHRLRADGVIVQKTVFSKTLMLVTLLLMLFLLLVFKQSWMDYAGHLLDESLFRKVNSSSYAERTGWNQAALDAFLATDGIGVGAGSVRTSNLFINILASTGVLGALVFCLFLRVVFTAKAPDSDARAVIIIAALKRALIPIFTGFALAGTTPDFGLMQGAFFGIIVGLGRRR